MELITSGVDLMYIRDLLGHSSVTTTEIYARTDAKLKRKAIERQWRTLKESWLYALDLDSTVSIDRIYYDVPMQFIASKVEIRFLPDDMSSAYNLYDGEHYPIRQTDRNENCRTKRNNTPSLDYSRMGGDS